MIPNTIIIAMTEIRHEVESAPDDLISKLKAAMKAARGSSFCRTEDEQFRAAVGAVMMHYGEGSEEFKRLESEMKNIQAASLMIQAAMAGMMVMPPEIDEGYEPIGLLGMWRQSE